MTAKEYLGQAYRLDQRISSKLEQIESLSALATKVTTTLTGMPRGSRKSTSRTEDVTAKLIDLQAEINQDVDKLVDLKREIMAAIKKVGNPEYQMLLELRYLSFKTWEQIAEDLDCDIRHATRLHGQALLEVEF